eukprot:1483981-Prymnesium_polylepis.1
MSQSLGVSTCGSGRRDGSARAKLLCEAAVRSCSAKLCEAAVRSCATHLDAPEAIEGDGARPQLQPRVELRV